MVLCVQHIWKEDWENGLVHCPGRLFFRTASHLDVALCVSALDFFKGLKHLWE